MNQALRVRPVAVSWAVAVGIDLFFNAGLFAGLFDQSREPSLLSDSELFRRIPVTYLALAVGVAVLAWLFDRMDVAGSKAGVRVGSIGGALFALLGVVNLWTAVEITGIFVAAAAFVQVAEFAAVGWLLATYRSSPAPERLTRRALGAAVVLAVAGVVIQNILGT